MIAAISPIDGRYASKVEALTDAFFEYALIRNRVLVSALAQALCVEEVSRVSFIECR